MRPFFTFTITYYRDLRAIFYSNTAVIMLVLFYVVLAFVLAQCVFWSIQGTSYAGLAVTVVS